MLITEALQTLGDRFEYSRFDQRPLELDFTPPPASVSYRDHVFAVNLAVSSEQITPQQVGETCVPGEVLLFTHQIPVCSVQGWNALFRDANEVALSFISSS